MSGPAVAGLFAGVEQDETRRPATPTSRTKTREHRFILCLKVAKVVQKLKIILAFFATLVCNSAQ